MTINRFNAITYSNKLKEAGLESSIANVHAEEIANVINNEVATKQDMTILEHKLVIKLGSIVVGCTFIISLMIGILGFLLKH